MSAKPNILQSFSSSWQRNMAIEKFVQEIAAGYQLSPAEREVVKLYNGRGQTFAKDASANNEALLYEFYTPGYIAEYMYKLAVHYGYSGGNILEPSCATGKIIDVIPTDIQSKVVGVELNEVTAKIAKLLYPKATIHNISFEQLFLNPKRGRWKKLKGKTTWLEQYPFELVIGNPPYGTWESYYKALFRNETTYQKVELMFLYKGLELLKKDGILVYLTMSSFLQTGHSFDYIKEKVLEIATMVDAFRMPSVFERSSVPTDVLVFKKK